MSALTESTEVTNERRRAGLSLILIAALLVAFFAAWPLISEPGFLNTRGGGDSPFLLQRLHQLEAALRDGHFPARWMRDANYGFGYPFYNYYAPLSIYIAALFRFLGFSFVRAIEAAQLLGFLTAALGVFLLARRWYRHEWAAFLASVAYTTAPFHLVNVYVRGDSLAEFWAMAFYPWVILAADGLMTSNGDGFPYGRVAALALAYAALILSHNISALIFTPFLLLFILLRWLLRRWPIMDANIAPFSGQELRKLLPLLGAGLLALALAAWFFIPALAEQNFAQLGPVTEGYFSYANHFRGFDLVQTSTFFDFDVSGGNAFRMGLVQAIAALLGALALIYVAFWQRAVAWGPALFILLALAISTFMVTPLSSFLWDNLPLLSFTQFPWRFLSIQAFAAALAIGALALLPYCRVLAIATAVILILSSFAALQTDHLLLADEDITAASLADYEWYTGNIGSTVSAEYLPHTVQPRFNSSAWLNSSRRANARALAGELVDAQQIENKTASQRWTVETGAEGALVLFPTMAWPGWVAAVDGRAVDIEPAPGSGLITLDLPPGEHALTLELTRTPLRRFAELLSLGALFLLLFLAVKAWRPLDATPTAVLVAVALFAFLLLFRLWPEEILSAGTQTWDFAQMAYLHHDEAGVPFNSGTTLLRYEYDRETVSAGQALSLTLHFSEANGDEVTVALASPAVTWPAFDPQAPLLAAQSKRLDQETIAFTLPIPPNTPAGLFIPRVTMKVGRPLMLSGKLRGDLFLRPLPVTNDQAAESGTSALDVQVEAVQLRDPSTLDVQLAWRTREPLSHNYNASLLLIDEAGTWLAQLDTQPGYGFLPSSEWLPGLAVNDWLALGLADMLPQESPLALVARLYEVDTGAVVLTRRLGEVFFAGGEVTFEENQPTFTLPEELTRLTAVFDDQIQLQGYYLQRAEDGTWQLTLYWQALQPNLQDAIRFVHVFDPESEEIRYQNDGHPANNSYPTSQWIAGEIIADPITIRLENAPAAEYQIGIGFYRQEENVTERLTAVDPSTGNPIPDDRVLLPDLLNHR
jgi:hypothetical protein